MIVRFINTHVVLKKVNYSRIRENIKKKRTLFYKVEFKTLITDGGFVSIFVKP